MQLYSRIATEFSIEPLGGTGLYLRSLVNTDQILFILREYYGLEGEDVEMCRCVRPYLLLIIQAYLTKVEVTYVQYVCVYVCMPSWLYIRRNRMGQGRHGDPIQNTCV